MRRRYFMLSPAAAIFISHPRLDRARSATVPAARQAGADASAQVLRLTPPGPLEDGHGQAVIDAVRGRVLLAARPPAATVVLDLSAVEALDGTWCAVLVALNDSLRASGKAGVAGVPGRLVGELEKVGVGDHIGADAIHSSVRTALLAIHAAMPGPGLVTPQVRAWLAECAEDVAIPAR